MVVALAQAYEACAHILGIVQRDVIQLLPGRDGLLHISQIANERVNAVTNEKIQGSQFAKGVAANR